jgi:hypothetical protein
MQLVWQPCDIERDVRFLVQPIDETLADIAEGSDVVGEYLNAQRHGIASLGSRSNFH